MQNFSEDIIRNRLGLQKNEKDKVQEIKTPQENSVCFGSGCKGCSEYSKSPDGKCKSCGCDFIDHTIFSDEEIEFGDEEYESEYGGCENW